MKTLENININNQAETVDTFLKFAYCFPMNLHDRFKEYYGESMGEHFWNKFQGYNERKSNSFVALIYTYGDMSTDNQRTFMKIVNDYYS